MAIKTSLALLGKRLGYKVYGNGICKPIAKKEKFKNREWLYDLMWYKDGKEDYIIKEFNVAFEIEWGNTRYKEEKNNHHIRFGEAKYDFQKLIVSNAELCVFIFQINKTMCINKDFEEIIEFIRTQFFEYNRLIDNTPFLLVGYDKKRKSFMHSTITFTNKKDNSISEPRLYSKSVFNKQLISIKQQRMIWPNKFCYYDSLLSLLLSIHHK